MRWLTESTVLNALTAGVVLATGYLAWATRNMAAATRAQAELMARPYIAFSGFHFRLFVKDLASPPTDADVKIGLTFDNPGHVLVQYEVKSLHITLAGKTIDNPTFQTRGGPIYPSGSAVFWYGAIPSVPVAQFPVTGFVEFEIGYWAEGSPEKKRYSAKLSYTILDRQTGQCDWNYVDGPTFS